MTAIPSNFSEGPGSLPKVLRVGILGLGEIAQVSLGLTTVLHDIHNV